MTRPFRAGRSGRWRGRRAVRRRPRDRTRLRPSSRCRDRRQDRTAAAASRRPWREQPRCRGKSCGRSAHPGSREPRARRSGCFSAARSTSSALRILRISSPHFGLIAPAQHAGTARRTLSARAAVGPGARAACPGLGRRFGQPPCRKHEQAMSRRERMHGSREQVQSTTVYGQERTPPHSDVGPQSSMPGQARRFCSNAADLQTLSDSSRLSLLRPRRLQGRPPCPSPPVRGDRVRRHFSIRPGMAGIDPKPRCYINSSSSIIPDFVNPVPGPASRCRSTCRRSSTPISSAVG